MTRLAAVGLYPGALGFGVYSMNWVLSSWLWEVAAWARAVPEGLLMAILVDRRASMAAWVAEADVSCSCLEGRAISSWEGM